MKTFEILLSYKCNSRCIYCFLPEHRREESISIDVAVKRISQAKLEGAENIYFSGGEPTIYPDIHKLAMISRDLGFKKILIRTNGMRLSYEDYLDKLISSGVNGFCVSAKSHKPEIHDHLSRVDGGFNLLMSALKNITSRNIYVEMDVFTHSVNYKTLLDMAMFFYDEKIRNFNFQFISSHFDPSGNFTELRVNEKEASSYIVEACKWILTHKDTTARIYYVSPCFLFPDHELFHNLKKENLVVSDVSGHSFALETTPLQGQIKTNVCGKCGKSNECPGFRQEYLEIFGEPENTPFTL